MNNRSKGLGFKPDLPDIRDLTFEAEGIIRKKKVLPSVVDLRMHEDMPPVYDQGTLGSCTAQSVGTLCDFEYGSAFQYLPSTLFLYYVTRSLEGTVDIDNGATIRNTIKAANQFGVPTHNFWPYTIAKFKDTPPQSIYDIAANHQALEYRKVRQRLDDLRECLSQGNLIAFGFCVYEGLYQITRAKPEIELPDYSQELLGGHAVVACGYNDDREHFIIRNSWGSSWGVSGYFYMPYSFSLT